MAVGVAGGDVPVEFRKNYRYVHVTRDDRKQRRKKAPQRSSRAIAGQWILNDWRRISTLNSDWLGRMAWNENLDELEAEILLRACNKVRRASEKMFWGAYGRP